VVGGSSGLGLEIARGLGLRGAEIYLFARSPSKLKRAHQTLNSEGISSVHTLRMDVTQRLSVEKGARSLLKETGRVDILVCTAGTHLKKAFLQMNPKEWRGVLETNLTGTFHVNQVFGKIMIKQKKGVIINTASLGSRQALSGTSAYNVSKSGVEMLTRCLAVEWARYGVRVNALLPGVFLTPLNKKALGNPTRRKRILGRTPLGRLGKLPEIVPAVLFLASDNASFVTGSTVTVDGGFLAYSGF